MAASVPNWIRTAHVYTPGRGAMTSPTAVPIEDYRPTKTQVVVTVGSSRGPVERRFRLSDLKEVSSNWPRPMLAAADDPRVVSALRSGVVDAAANRFLSALSEHRIRTGMEAEDLLASLDAVRLAAAKSMAMLSEVLDAPS